VSRRGFVGTIDRGQLERSEVCLTPPIRGATMEKCLNTAQEEMNMEEACSDCDERGAAKGIPFIGIRQAMRAVSTGQKVLTVYIARDADRRVTGRLERICRESGIELRWMDTRLALGRSFGIDVGASAVAIVLDQDRVS
jgi:large subunit ribosomal protein L7A